MERDEAQFAIYSARRLINAVSANPNHAIQIAGGEPLTPPALRSLKTKVIFSLWDDMIEIGEGEIADKIIEGEES